MNQYISDTNQTIGVVTGAVSSPVWVPWLSNVNTVLSLVLTVLGIALAVIKLYQAFKKPKVK